MSQEEGGMAAVIGLESQLLLNLLPMKEKGIDLANFNSPGQIVVSGPEEEISLVPLKNAGAKLVVPLKVSGAFTHVMKNLPKNLVNSYATSVSRKLPFRCMETTAVPYSDASSISETLVRQSTVPFVGQTQFWLCAEGADSFENADRDGF